MAVGGMLTSMREAEPEALHLWHVPQDRTKSHPPESTTSRWK